MASQHPRWARPSLAPGTRFTREVALLAEPRRPLPHRSLVDSARWQAAREPPAPAASYFVISRDTTFETTVRYLAELASHSATCGLVPARSMKIASRSALGALIEIRCV